MTRILSNVQTRILAASDTAKVSKKMKYGSELLIEEDESSISFEDGKFDFDLLEDCLKLFSKTNQKYLLTRGLSAPTVKELRQAVRDTLKGLPIRNADMLNNLFNKDFAKSYTQFLLDLQQLDSVLTKMG